MVQVVSTQVEMGRLVFSWIDMGRGEYNQVDCSKTFLIKMSNGRVDKRSKVDLVLVESGRWST